MSHVSRRAAKTVAAACLSLLLAAPAALAGTPATVTVRVLGPAPAYQALTPPTVVTTTSAQITKNGGACSGTSAAGGLDLATKGNWEGPWNSEFEDYELTSIDGLMYLFEPSSPANYYWSFWRDNVYEEAGICEVELQSGDQVLFVPSCYGANCPPAPPGLLGVQAPSSAQAGEQVALTVERFNEKGEPAPLAGATVSGGATSVQTDAQGHATLAFACEGSYTLRASGPTAEEPKSVPAETLLTVHGGSCGTPVPGSTQKAPQVQCASASCGLAVHAPYTGPYAIVAAAAGLSEGHVYGHGAAPRVLAGKVATQSSVTSISLRLRRDLHGRCWAYDGASERFVRARCGQGGFFKVASGGSSFSYLLPTRLPAGRYVLDISATDTAGNRTALARGSTRTVFYVK